MRIFTDFSVWLFGKLFVNFSHLTISTLFELSEVLSFYYIKNRKNKKPP